MWNPRFRTPISMGISGGRQEAKKSFDIIDEAAL
jgi:hypothetical protein